MNALHPPLAGTPEQAIATMADDARRASRSLSRLSTAARSAALDCAAAALRAAAGDIISVNALDMADGRTGGLSSAMLDRLLLTPERVAAMADAVAAVGRLPDPLGRIIDEIARPNGLVMQRRRIPIGVIGIIYESRPNVTADAAALCVMAGNAVILRGGSEAARSNHAIHAAMVAGLSRAGVPAAAVQIVPTQDRAMVGAMLRAQGSIDLIIPRGGKTLVARIEEEARVPVLAHLDGINHVYVHAAADPAMAAAIAVNAKMRRTAICGAAETILIDTGFASPAMVIGALLDAGCEVRGDAAACALNPTVRPAGPDDWGTEYLDAIVSVAMVDGLDAACAHIAAYGSGHTDAIVTEDAGAAEAFFDHVDSAILLWNASTQFADGGEFGMGAEIGIATGRLHARGPVALEGLTTYKWIVRGNGQIRP